MSVPALTVSEAVGYATVLGKDNIFDDVQTVGSWPARLDIKKVSLITIFTDSATVIGIEVIYFLQNGKMMGASHGKVTDRNTFFDAGDLNATTSFVGFYGARDKDGDKPVLRNIGFLIYDKATGVISAPIGAVPTLSDSVVKNATGFASLGEIVGFSGTTSSNGRPFIPLSMSTAMLTVEQACSIHWLFTSSWVLSLDKEGISINGNFLSRMNLAKN
ncbi:hypothetical protein DXG01_004880 [Tephrocybe rancida]|nr:hypothetical protein DXG01_004880 [Tephrocybe rancida]